MKVAVIGLGSMGKRRIRLLRELFPYYEIIGIESIEDRKNEVAKLFSINCFDSIASAPKDIQCAFVCTSPLSHSSIIKKCLLNKWNVFTELNLVLDGYEENMTLAKENDCKLFLSSTFMYREETRFICNKVSSEDTWNYVYHIGQYLPDWHPWENYKDFFIGDKLTNGCREILAIELPWIVKAFGMIKNVNSISNKMSSLNINYNDNFYIQLEHENGNKGFLVVDVVCPIAVRDFHAYTEGKYISWNGTPDTLYEFDSFEKKLVKINLTEKVERIEGYREYIVENAYKNEIIEFFNVVEDRKVPEYGFEDDLKVLSLIDLIGA